MSKLDDVIINDEALNLIEDNLELLDTDGVWGFFDSLSNEIRFYDMNWVVPTLAYFLSNMFDGDLKKFFDHMCIREEFLKWNTFDTMLFKIQHSPYSEYKTLDLFYGVSKYLENPLDINVDYNVLMSMQVLGTDSYIGKENIKPGPCLVLTHQQHLPKTFLKKCSGTKLYHQLWVSKNTFPDATTDPIPIGYARAYLKSCAFHDAPTVLAEAIKNEPGLGLDKIHRLEFSYSPMYNNSGVNGGYIWVPAETLCKAPKWASGDHSGMLSILPKNILLENNLPVYDL